MSIYLALFRGTPLGLCVAVALLCGAPTNAEVIDFISVPPSDPDKCSVDIHGKALVRLSSGLAFLFGRGSFELRDDAPPATGEIEGCPTDPVVTLAATSWTPDPAHPEGNGGGRAMLLSSPQGLWLSGTGSATISQDLMIEWAEEAKHRGEVCSVTGEGVEICHDFCRPNPYQANRCSNEGRSIRLKSQSTVKGIALPGRYTEFEGRPFAFHCSPSIKWGSDLTQSFQTCEVAYRITDGLWVSYKFDAAQFPLDHILELDRQIRAQVMAARAPEYDVKP